MTSLAYHPPPTHAESTRVSQTAAVRAMPVPEVFELSAERWNRWIAKGHAHDRNVKRRFQLVAGVVAAIAVALLLWMR